MFKISHDKFHHLKKDDPIVRKEIETYSDAWQINPEIEKWVKGPGGLVRILNPVDVLHILSRIPDEDFPYLFMNPVHSHPKDMVLTRIAVPPPCTRPSLLLPERCGSIETDITMMLLEIVFMNDVIKKHRQLGVKIEKILEDWDFLQLQCALHVNSECTLSGVPLHMLPKTHRKGLIQSLQGKHGRFRADLSGKRVDFSGRTVISPNPTLRIDQIGIPTSMAKLLTYPIHVNTKNIEEMRRLVLNGCKSYPGANSVKEEDSNVFKLLTFQKRIQNIACNLKVLSIFSVLNQLAQFIV